MSILTQVSIPDAFIIFFLTLGPLKAIGPFARVTQGADAILRRTLAWRSTLIATVIVLIVALVGAMIVLPIFSRLHDRSMEKLGWQN